jgi:hypothetical protein
MPVRSAALNRMSFITAGQASASTHILILCNYCAAYNFKFATDEPGYVEIDSINVHILVSGLEMVVQGSQC